VGDHTRERERDSAYRTLAASLPDMLVVIFDRDLKVRVIEGGGLRHSLLGSQELEGRRVGDIVDEDARDHIEGHHHAALEGSTVEFGYASPHTQREYRVTVSPLQDSEEQLGLAVWHDVTERNESQRRLQHLADHDALTGLLNRRSFEQVVDRHLSLSRRYGAQGALLLIDIDHFKYVNDTLGHSAGDDLILLISDALRHRLRESDVLARLGGDEFAVLLPQVDVEGARIVAESLVQDLRGHVRDGAETRMRPVTASIGVAMVSGSEANSDELLTNADLAMYDAKEAGRDQYALYGADSEDEPRLRARIRWLDRIQDALEHDRFVLHGQPIVDLRSYETVSHELLLRMTDEQGAIIPPVAFLPIAERFGLVQDIDRWVIGRAIDLAAQRKGERFSVNLSAKSLSEPDLMDFIAERIRDMRVDPRQLTFEITETAAVTNVALARRFAEGLHDLGCRLSLDDFGAGFGSFYYLKHLPFDVVKIDGEFVSGCTSNRTDQLVIDAVVRMAEGLSKETVAEFTGDRDTAAFLRRAGVNCAQGFYLGRPVPMTRSLPLLSSLSDSRPTASTAA
jgi:diguanylate cyclase (GGDEF)-like protein/PAS domain S-box-containing protein